MVSRRRNLRSISTPIILGAVSVPLSVALLVGWTILVATNLDQASDITLDVWLLVLGAISFMVIVTVLVLFSFYLAREILEVRRQDSFIDSVTHELKTPLASLKLCLETSARHDLPEEKKQHLHEMMLDDVERLSLFIDDVLQASRLAFSKNKELHPASVHLRALARRISDSITTRRKLDPDVVFVDIPRDFLVQTDEAVLGVVLNNLIDNALKYSGSNPNVRVTATLGKGGKTMIEVHDDGIGIASADLKRVFQRFYRVPSSEVRKRKGTGLGLFVVHALVRNLGGDVQALSDGLGKGTRMRVTLPSHRHLLSKIGKPSHA